MVTFAYTRVSTSDQTTENQKIEIENAGYKIDFWFSDICSGKLSAFERKEFSILMDRIRDGETLVVSKLDRLGRDSIDILQTIENLAKRDIKIIVLQLGNLDLNSSAGKMMLTMLAAVAEMERNLIVERINTGLVRARSQGKGNYV